MYVCSNANTKQGRTVSSHVRGTVYTPGPLSHWVSPSVSLLACAGHFGRDPPFFLLDPDVCFFFFGFLDLRSGGLCQQATVWQNLTCITLWKCKSENVGIRESCLKTADKSWNDFNERYLELCFLSAGRGAALLYFCQRSALVCVSYDVWG